MVSITIENMQKISDENLEELLRVCTEEKDRRYKLARIKLIEDFHNAWNALQSARIGIKYYEEDYDDNYMRLDRWDGFDFY